MLAWTELNWLRTGTSSGFLLRR